MPSTPKRRLRGAEQAAKIALKPFFPLMLFIFPTPPAVLIGPSAIQVVGQRFPTMAARSDGRANERTVLTGESHVCVELVS
ncbi:hypothetical protein AYM40_30755 [Paraburkholderia phytofirmans OLGA172]|uniref:Uncharacterized protein n=1 Tax=Paraburkholderia phytofirmans OLGA172 TaxID=1417228 RepID=A0A167WGG2_9BURK|nr:hypothetical protein AYM40_30755 [Paraburkholderia phytofirmans OLGA172]